MALVGVAEAARQLTALGAPVNKSTVSRWLQANSALNKSRSGRGRPLVDVEELCRYQAEQLDPVKRTRGAGSISAVAQSGNMPADGSAAEASIGGDGGALLSARRRAAEADAATKELNLARLQGRLTVVEDVERAAHEAALLAQAALLNLPRDMGLPAAQADEMQARMTAIFEELAKAMQARSDRHAAA